MRGHFYCFYQILQGGSSKYNQARKIKSHQIGKEEVKLSLFADIIIKGEYNGIYRKSNESVQEDQRVHDQYMKTNFYMLAMNNQKFSKKYHVEWYEKYEMLGDKSDKINIRLFH